ncbi:magnesium and cobalt transport protein CorA [Xylanimonas cellulosilytica DSM 15894]|uniref:Magnesium transport protein CorA n=1 Tax=Xylanimonas cellulosilytica (strain DSM 15894 / JCM 12276 / CECT 5975 / KCTC 9989 / LMG 20990 / NBRC 107835 / XIL07) TaxID=446471 RepID=D1BUR9_XYLCX|nr:magnesium/cobalt transporter CorA [Xylanimonas cellulosilytica]ACZ29310.1 magnesium and cobalt transport protein CorA [Xylanimonas cellulosilytica DSM 15894]
MATTLPTRTSRQLLSGVLRSRRRPDGVAPVVDTVPPRRRALVTSAIYDDGARTSSHATLGETFRALRSRPGGMAWIGLERPDPRELASLAAEFDLHALAVEDAIQAHQRPKLERYGDTLFIVLHAARYDDAAEEVEFSELHVFVGPDFVVTVRHGASPNLPAVRRRLEADPVMLARGPEAVLYAILDAVVDGYAPVVAGLENDIDEIESQVFSMGAEASRRIYELSREVADFQRAVRPLRQVLHALTKGFAKYEVDEEQQARLRDVADHLTEVAERVETHRGALRDILTVNATLVAQRQNEEAKAQNDEIKKISSWAAILFAPTVVGGIYGMNFDVMPELHWAFGYPFALGLMLAVSVVLWGVFRLRRWI